MSQVEEVETPQEDHVDQPEALSASQENGAEQAASEQHASDPTKPSSEQAQTEQANIVDDQSDEEGGVPEENVATDPNGFEQLGLSKPLLEALEAQGYTEPTPIQAQIIPYVRDGRDVVGQAQTGTGKTAAFALPLIDRVDLKNRKPQVLVLAPTRELAIQVAESFKTYSRRIPGLNIVSIYGGQSYDIQLRPLQKGAHVVVGTPGRVMDHMRKGTLRLGELKCLVLDEADEMLRMGFAEDVDWVLTQVPKQRQIALFSATMPAPIRKIAQQHLNDPAEVTIEQKSRTADTINQRYIVAPPKHKQVALTRILESETIDGVLIFVKMRSTTEPLAENLAAAGFRTAALNGDVVQKNRERIVERLKSGKIDIIVATDVAARGLDVDRISHVINYDLPFDSEAYIHRIGRTGRAGRSGEAILFVHPRERRLLKRLEQATRQTIAQMDLPSNRAINKQRVARFHDKITAAVGHRDIDSFQSIVQQYQRDNDVPVEMIAAALAVMANGEKSLLVKGEIKQAEFSDDSRKGGGRYGDRKRGSRDRGGKPRRDDRPHQAEAGMETYRVEVGRMNRVQAGNLVGAIANKAGINGRSIGRIQIFDRFSTVDLPEGLGEEKLEQIRAASVGGRKLKISRMDPNAPQPDKSKSDYSKTFKGKKKVKLKGKKRKAK